MKDLKHIDTWIFDLDGTLYPSDHEVFTQIDRRMAEYVSNMLDIPFEKSLALVKNYYKTHGTTLRGLMLEHDIVPGDFLDYAHDIDLSSLKLNEGLNEALSGLEGRKLVYTNGSYKHAMNVLSQLGIADHFEGVFDIAAADYIPKPQAEPFKLFIRKFEVDPLKSLMFEDMHANLQTARGFGIKTALIYPTLCELHPHVDHHIDDLALWLKLLAEMKRGE